MTSSASASAITGESILGDCFRHAIFVCFKAQIISAIENCQPALLPFRHLCIDNILPASLYRALCTKIAQHGATGSELLLQTDQSLEMQYLQALFSDQELKLAFLQKFFLQTAQPLSALAATLEIDQTSGLRCRAGADMPAIRVDIPPHFLVLLLYLPQQATDGQAGQDAQDTGDGPASVLYDQQLQAHPGTRCQSNTLCVFAPHFYTYHSLQATRRQAVMEMLYLHPAEMAQWQAGADAAQPSSELFRDAARAKLMRYPLIEYGSDQARQEDAQQGWLVNAAQGGVIAHQAMPRPPGLHGAA